jgi:Fe-S oxidoreductase
MSQGRRLEMLDERRAALETCAFCPKLSRSACPVSEAEASESVTPWGKVSGTYDVARGATAPSREHAALAWACTGCLHCRELCELKNPVAATLIAARSEYRRRGLAPSRSDDLVEAFPARLSRLGDRTARLRELARHRDDAPSAVLLGCDYTLKLQREAEDALRALVRLFGPLRLLSGCCGMPLDTAGESERADGLRDDLVRAADGAKRFIALDAGCAFRLRNSGATPFAEAVWPRIAELRLRPEAGLSGRFRYHDPCLLGRGLGVYEAPRRLLERAIHAAPEEFTHRRERAHCSGAGALLPLTRPETAGRIAETRVREHARLGGGTIVTGCGGSLRSFRRAGAEVIDLASVVRWLVLP